MSNLADLGFIPAPKPSQAFVDFREGPALSSSFLALPKAEREQRIAAMTPEELELLHYDWPFWARQNQMMPPGEWSIWVLLAGRGFGKTRIGAELVRHWARSNERVNLMGATADDARDIMIEGDSGLMAVCPKSERPIYNKSSRKLTWPSGATSLIFTADEPDRLRGKQHHKFWGDEAAAWRYQESLDQAIMGLRLGNHPQMLLTTTPRPLPWIKELLLQKDMIITKGRTFDNSDNLAPTFLSGLIKKYEGTRMGRQELDAEILDDSPGALWQRGWFKYTEAGTKVKIIRAVVAVDPAVTVTDDSDETGLVCAGLGEDGFGYILADWSGKHTPGEWAKKAVELFKEFDCETIVAEVNQGGDMVEAMIRQVNALVPVIKIHAKKSKHSRAQPIALLYEQGRVFHKGSFGTLEDQLCSYDPSIYKESPDRLDALVYAMTHMMLNDVASGEEVATEASWRPWPETKPPSCTGIIISLAVDADEKVATLTCFGIFNPPDGKLPCGIMLAHKRINGTLDKIVDETTTMYKLHKATQVVMPAGRMSLFVCAAIKRVARLPVKLVPYDYDLGVYGAKEVLDAGRGFYPVKLNWAKDLVREVSRWPHCMHMTDAHSVATALVYLRLQRELKSVAEEPITEAQPKVGGSAIYG